MKKNNINNYNNYNDDYYQSSLDQENQYYNRNNIYEDSSNNNRKGDYDNYNNYLNSNKYDLYSKSINKAPNKYFNTKAFNNNMNNRLVSPNILVSKNINKNRNTNNKNQKKLTDLPLSPYLLSKFNLKNNMNKNNSAMNVLSNNKRQNFNNNNNSNNKFPNINQNNLMKNSSSTNLNMGSSSNDINLNFYKTDTIFNYQPKNNIFIPIVSNKRLDSIKSTNTQKLKNNILKTSEISSPVSVEPQNKLNFDIKDFHNLKKNHHEKGYGRHYGNEKECPVCQSIIMKNNFLMKNMNNYNDILKHKDHERIKFNKEQFLQELKKPNSRIQREEASIIRQIRQFLGTNKKKNFFENNSEQNDENVINAYFGL